MTPDPILSTSAIIQIHAGAATLAVLIGPVALWRRSRDRVHRVAGRAWIAAMAVAALSSFGIAGLAVIGPLGPIHLLSAWVLWSLRAGLRHVRAGRVAAHRATFRSLYWNGLVLAGALTLMPGRRLNTALFPEAPEAGWLAMAAVLAGLLVRAAAARRRAQLSERATFMSLT